MKLQNKNPVLRNTTYPMIPSKMWKPVVEDMFRTMEAENGIGLAAPQVGIPNRLFVANVGGLRAFANPKILLRSGPDIEALEGCLSLPGKGYNVTRCQSITIEWVDPVTGHQGSETFRNYAARIIQHELDHLDGVLIDSK